MSNDLKPGDVVRATKFIVDTDGRGGHYLHAIPGTYGVVVDCDQPATWPNVQWDLCGRGGVCNVSSDAFVKVISGVWYAVDGIVIDS